MPSKILAEERNPAASPNNPEFQIFTDAFQVAAIHGFATTGPRGVATLWSKVLKALVWEEWIPKGGWIDTTLTGAIDYTFRTWASPPVSITGVVATPFRGVKNFIGYKLCDDYLIPSFPREHQTAVGGAFMFGFEFLESLILDPLVLHLVSRSLAMTGAVAVTPLAFYPLGSAALEAAAMTVTVPLVKAVAEVLSVVTTDPSAAAPETPTLDELSNAASSSLDWILRNVVVYDETVFVLSAAQSAVKTVSGAALKAARYVGAPVYVLAESLSSSLNEDYTEPIFNSLGEYDGEKIVPAEKSWWKLWEGAKIISGAIFSGIDYINDLYINLV